MGQVIERRLLGLSLGQITLLDAVATGPKDDRSAILFFASGSDLSSLAHADGVVPLSQISVGGAACITYPLPADGRLRLTLDGAPVDITPVESEQDRFEGLNCIAAVRNGEDAQTVAVWVQHHVKTQSLQAVVIVDRAKPGADPAFASGLAAELNRLSVDCDVTILTSDLPLGRTDTPAEAHPFCVPEAPGKDRMKVPKPSPWDSPLGAMSLYEILRARFLGQARAVCNIEVHDLMPLGAPNVFDSAVEADGGVIALFGRHCYPWRVRKDDPTRFADHICVQFDAKGGPSSVLSRCQACAVRLCCAFCFLLQGCLSCR